MPIGPSLGPWGQAGLARAGFSPSGRVGSGDRLHLQPQPCPQVHQEKPLLPWAGGPRRQILGILGKQGEGPAWGAPSNQEAWTALPAEGREAQRGSPVRPSLPRQSMGPACDLQVKVSVCGCPETVPFSCRTGRWEDPEEAGGGERRQDRGGGDSRGRKGSAPAGRPRPAVSVQAISGPLKAREC